VVVTVAEVPPLRQAEGIVAAERTRANEARAAVEMAAPKPRVQARQLERIQPQPLVLAHRVRPAEMLLLAVMLPPGTVAETAAEVAGAVVAVLPCKFDLPPKPVSTQWQ